MTKHVRTTKPGHAFTFSGATYDNVGIDVSDGAATAAVARAVELGIATAVTDVAPGTDRGLVPGYDTGWRDVTHQVVPDADERLLLARRVGQYVTVAVISGGSDAESLDGNEMPAGFRPAWIAGQEGFYASISSQMVSDDGTPNGQIRFTGGVFQCSDLSTGGPYMGSFTYLTDDLFPSTVPGVAA